MEVVLDRDTFLKGLQMVQNIVEPKQTLPILANVLIETEDDAVRVTATDLEVGARVSVPARVAAKGTITLGARKLGEIVRELPAAAVTLKLHDNAVVGLRCGGASYRLVGLAADDFPPVVPASAPAWLTVEARTLRGMLTRTSFAVSQDETRYALNGVLFAVAPGELRLVATDGHRLAMATTALEHAVPPVSAIVPRKAIAEILRVLGTGEEVNIAITDNQFVLQMPNFVMTARLVEGQFPNYEAVLPKGHPFQVRVSRGALMAAVRRVAVLAEERNKPVKWVVSTDSLRLQASSHELGEAEEVLEVAYAGDEIAIGFNSRYVLDALSPLEKDAVTIEVRDALSSAVVKSPEDEGYCCVIMPMRI